MPTWTAWAKEEWASAVPGALEFIKYARSKDVRVFYVTNRRDDVKQATINNLRALGFPAGDDYVLTRNDEENRPSDKVSRRAKVASAIRGGNEQRGPRCADLVVAELALQELWRDDEQHEVRGGYLQLDVIDECCAGRNAHPRQRRAEDVVGMDIHAKLQRLRRNSDLHLWTRRRFSH